MTNPDSPQSSVPVKTVTPKARPHYIIGSLWLIVGLFGGFGYLFSSAPGHLNGLWIGPLLIAYAIYLYRGGRWVIFFF